MNVSQSSNEAERLNVLRQLQLMGTPAEPAFDGLAALVAQVCQVPIAIIAFMDDERQWFKSHVGVDLQETPREGSFCALTILQPDAIFEVTDTHADPRFAANPLVTGREAIRFYAGVALVTSEGYAVGTLSVLDTRPRCLTPDQRMALLCLRRAIMTEVELRRVSGEREVVHAGLRAAGERYETQATAHSSELHQVNQRLATAVQARDLAERGTETARLELAAAVEARDLAEQGTETARLELAAAIEGVSDGIVSFDRNWRYTFVNAQAGRMIGRAPEELLGRNIWELFPEAIGEPLHRIYEQAMAEKKPTQVEEYYAPWDRWFENRIFPLPEGILVFFHDITERKKAVAELKNSEEQFRLFVEQIPAAVAVLDRDMRYLAASDRWVSVCRLDKQGLIGRSHYELFPNLPQRWLEVHRRCLAGATETSEADVIAWLDGSTDWIRWEVRPWRTPAGRIGGLIIFSEIITDRKQAEAPLQESYERYSLVLAGANDAIWDWDVAKHKVHYAPRWKELRGYAADEIGDSEEEWRNSIHPEDAPRVENELKSHLAGLTPHFQAEYRVRCKDGSWKWVLDRGLARRDAQGKVNRMAGSETDITERKRMEEALRESETRLRLALNAAQLGVFDWDLANRHITWSRRHDELFGFRPGEFDGTFELAMSRVHPDDVPGINDEVARCIKERDFYSREFRVVWPDGQVRWMHGMGQFEYDLEGQAVRMRGVTKDITEIKRVGAQRQQLLEQLLRAEDEARRRIARELHDTTAQHLAAVKLNLAGLGAAPLPESVRPALADSLALVEQSLREIRSLTYLLHPPILEELGLAGALRDYVEGFSRRTGLAIELDLEGFNGRLPREVELALFRVAQESLANVRSHSGSVTALVRLERDESEVWLEVQDNGHGLPPNALQSGAGVGLRGMRERLQQLGGRLEIESDRDGTTVLASAPLGPSQPETPS